MKKHIQQEFWQQVILDRRLTGGVSDGLTPPSQEEVVSKELDGAMQLAHASNPEVKSVHKLLNWMKYQSKSNVTEFFGLCKGCFESPSLSNISSKVLLDALLKIMARLRCDKTFPQHWESLRAHFDEQMASAWHAASSGQISRAQFLRANRETLQLFLCLDEATQVESSIAAGQEPDLNLVEKLCKASCVGAELFAAESLKIEMKQYIAEIFRRLVELDHCNYEEVEVASFRQVKERLNVRCAAD